MKNDLSAGLAEQVKQAYDEKSPLVITASGSKSFYGNAVKGSAIDVSQHSGIIEYHPSELVITARSGTPLCYVEKELADNGQMFAFEPLQHSANTTLGGVIACGLSGPRRGFSFAVRDAVLGTTIINGKGELLKFGGQVMKNVAGYDASRLMVGAQGTLGVLLDISIKVKPLSESDITLSYDKPFETAHEDINNWVMQGHPIRSSCYHEGRLHVRLSSTASSTSKSRQVMGGEEQDNSLWSDLKQQSHPFFSNNSNLWRLSVPPSTPLFCTDKPQMVEWGGALRWIDNDNEMFSIAKQYGGHATMYRPGHSSLENIFQPLPGSLLDIHRRIKHSFDPENILNPGRLYREL